MSERSGGGGGGETDITTTENAREARRCSGPGAEAAGGVDGGRLHATAATLGGVW